MSVPIVCCLLEHVLKQHLYLISCVIFTQRGQYNNKSCMMKDSFQIDWRTPVSTSNCPRGGSYNDEDNPESDHHQYY